jgi:hypothetical protein
MRGYGRASRVMLMADVAASAEARAGSKAANGWSRVAAEVP